MNNPETQATLGTCKTLSCAQCCLCLWIVKRCLVPNVACVSVYNPETHVTLGTRQCLTNEALEKTKGAVKHEQSRETGNIGHNQCCLCLWIVHA
jgi:hypothetical protein